MRPPIKYGKMLIYAQRWAGDQDQMMELLSLIADLEPHHNEIAEFVMFPRFDCRTRYYDKIHKLATKFPVHESRSKRQKVGWPLGPNAVAMDVFKEVHQKWKKGEFNYDAVMLMEADCVPLKRTWVADLYGEWCGQGKLFLGHWDGSETGPVPSHMNGNLIFHPAAMDVIPEMAYGEVPSRGWDMQWWEKMRRHSTPSRLIYSDYQLNTRKNPLNNPERLFATRYHRHPENPLRDQPLDISYLHGVKGLNGIHWARKKLLC